AFGTPSAANLRISAQSSKVITLQSLSVHFSPPQVFSFRAPPTLISPRMRFLGIGDMMRRLAARWFFSAGMIVFAGAVVNGCRQVVIHFPS
ncbi:hypothetical protein, partial [Microbacterium trichothecenolyticum]|uniref:hypothetical protein n=1 Tax=Microbacterium trichothecenolyticum TaxID=69370 RepID=UPI001B805664